MFHILKWCWGAVNTPINSPGVHGPHQGGEKGLGPASSINLVAPSHSAAVTEHSKPVTPKFKAKLQDFTGGTDGCFAWDPQILPHPQNLNSFRKVKRQNQAKQSVSLSGRIWELFRTKSENTLLPTSPWGQGVPRTGIPL